jgi:hypothetical protein
MVEFPDGTARNIPVSWTDRAVPQLHHMNGLKGLRLSPFALLEVCEWLQKIRKEKD